MPTIKGNTIALHPEFLRRLSAWNDALGGKFAVTVGVRTWEYQTELYNRYLAGKYPNLVAKPGPMARHCYGLAADVTPGATNAERAKAREFGLRMDVESEDWHIYHEDSKDLIASGKVKPVRDADVARLGLGGAALGPNAGSRDIPTAGDSESLPILDRGDRGPTVKRLQEFLIRMYPKTHGKIVLEAGGADGILGEGTERAIESFQRAVELKVDGIVGAKTWGALKKEGFN